MLDTNVLLYANQRVSTDATAVLKRCAAGDLVGFVPATVWEELCHRLMIIEAVASGKITGPNPARKLSERPDIVLELREYREVLSGLASMGLRFEPVLRGDVLTAAMALQQRFGLLTNDSIIAACAMRLGVDAIVSSDGCFSRLPEVKLVLINDQETP